MGSLLTRFHPSPGLDGSEENCDFKNLRELSVHPFSWASSRSQHTAQRGPGQVLFAWHNICLFKECDHGHVQVARVPLPAGLHQLASRIVLRGTGVPELWAGAGGCTKAWHLLLLFLPHHPVATERWPHWCVDGRQLPEAQLRFVKSSLSSTVLTAGHRPSLLPGTQSLGLPLEEMSGPASVTVFLTVFIAVSTEVAESTEKPFASAPQ